MVRLTRFVARSAFGLALAVAIGGGRANATENRICSMGGGIKNITVLDDRNIFVLPAELVKYGNWACLEIGVGAASLNAPTTSFLGVEDPVTQARRPLALHPDRTDVGSVINGTVTFGSLPNPVSPANPGSLTVGGSFASFSQDTFIPLIDPGTNRVLVFGTGNGLFGQGFNVGPGLGDFNDATDYRYSRSVDQFNVFGQYNMPIGTVGGVGVAALARLGYTRTNIDERQSASLLNVPLDIRNSVDLGVNTVTPGAGVQFLVPVTSNVALHAYGWAGLAISHASGHETSAFDGLFTGTQHNSISNSHAGFAGAIGGGFTLNLGGGWGASVNVTYLSTDSHPIIVRTGQAGERSRVEWDDADQLQVFFGTWLRFP